MAAIEVLTVDYAGINDAISSLGTTCSQVEACYSTVSPHIGPDFGNAAADAAVTDFVTDVLARLTSFTETLQTLQNTAADAVGRFSATDEHVGAIRAE
jgi:hypothetical protein